MNIGLSLRILIVLSLMAGAMGVAGQGSARILRIYAFSRMVSPGNRPVDSTYSFQPQSEYLIYVEANGKDLQFVNFWIDKKNYDVSVLKLDTNIVEVGKDATTQLKVKIKGSKSNTIWLLEASLSAPQKKMPPKYKNLKKGLGLLAVFYKSKKQYFIISPITRLMPDNIL